MFRNNYDNDNTTFSPQGRLHQVEYALEAVKQGSATVGLRSDTHAVLLTLKRSTGELASYQQKLYRIDDHIGIGIAGLTSDARVLSDFMRKDAMSEKAAFGRPLPLKRAVASLAEKAQINTQQYGKRPYGVGFLIIGQDKTGPHLFEFNPTGVCSEYQAMSIGSRSQSAKTYLEKNFAGFPQLSLENLIKHGLHALRDTLQQDKNLTETNLSIGVIGPDKSCPDGSFRIIEGQDVERYLQIMDPRKLPGAATAAQTAPAAPAEVIDEQTQSEVPAPIADVLPPPPAADRDEHMQD